MLLALLITIAVLVVTYLVVMCALIATGRSGDARAAARFVPDCAVLFRRLIGDPRLPRRRKVPLVLAGLYLLSPLDLIPDFVPVAGQLDDALVVMLALRHLLCGPDRRLVDEHWPGPARSLAVLQRLASTPPS